MSDQWTLESNKGEYMIEQGRMLYYLWSRSWNFGRQGNDYDSNLVDACQAAERMRKSAVYDIAIWSMQWLRI